MPTTRTGQVSELSGLAHRARHFAPAFEDLRIDLAPVRGEVDHQPRGDALVALDHAVGDVVPARHDGELVEDLLGDQRLAALAVARPEAVAQLVAQAVVAEVVELEGVVRRGAVEGQRRLRGLRPEKGRPPPVGSVFSLL